MPVSVSTNLADVGLKLQSILFMTLITLSRDERHRITNVPRITIINR